MYFSVTVRFKNVFFVLCVLFSCIIYVKSIINLLQYSTIQPIVLVWYPTKINTQNKENIFKTEKETQMYRTDFWTLWEKARVGCSERIALKQVYYQGWNRSPAQVGCMRQVLGAGALGSPRGMGWEGRQEGGSGWGTHVNPWLIHVNVWQKPLQYCKVISLQLIKINGKKTFLISQ